MASLQGIDVALRQQVSKSLNDILFPEFPFLATLQGFDAYYKAQGPTRFKNGADLHGSEIQEDFVTGAPRVEGVNAMNPTITALHMTPERNFNIESGSIPISAYQWEEWIAKYYWNRLDDSLESVEGAVATIGKLVKKAILDKLNKHMFSPTNLTPTIAAGDSTGPASIDKIMSLAYPLQSGYVLNAATGSGTYDYFGFNMNNAAYSGMKATQKGTTAAAFGTPSAINLRLLMQEIYNKGGTPDLLLGGGRLLSYLLSLPETKTSIINNGTNMEYGGVRLNIVGLELLAEPRMDKLALSSETGYSDEAETVSTTEYHEAYILDSSTWNFRISDMGKMTHIQDIPGYPTQEVLQGYFEAAFWCSNPRHNGRAFNITGLT